MRKCMILAAGPVYDYEPVRKLIQKDDFIICADGGIQHLSPLSLKPDVVMGDFDSAQGELPEGVPVLTFQKEKDETDTILAIRQALDREIKKIVIIGGIGGRLDHTYANFSALLYIAQQGGDGLLFDARNEARILLKGELRLKKRTDCFVSVFPFCSEATGVFEKGLKYTLNDATLRAGFPLGVSNEFKDEEAVISVREGPLLIILSKK